MRKHRILPLVSQLFTLTKTSPPTYFKAFVNNKPPYKQWLVLLLTMLCRHLLPPTPHSSMRSPATVILPEYYNNAKYEDIVCKPIKPLYDGILEHLVTFLNWLDLRRQDEGWYPIIFLTINGNVYDVNHHFAKLDESVMMHEATLCWTSSTVIKDKHTVDHPTYNARVLACLLLCSITDDFSLTINNKVPQHLCNDGPLLLWTMCTTP